VRESFKKPGWSPKKTGIWLGILCFVTIFFMHKPLGASSTFVRLYGFLVGLISVGHVHDTQYLSKFVSYKPVFEWQFMLLVGIFLGAFMSAKLSRMTFAPIPYLWIKNFGYSKIKRAIFAFIGGMITLFGARLAGRCTLGHGIAGAAQLATISLIFIPVFFLSGTIFAFLLYKRRR